MRINYPLTLLVVALLFLSPVPRGISAETGRSAAARPALASFAAAPAHPAALAESYQLFLPLVRAAAPAPKPAAPALLRLNYYHVSDSDGTRPADGVEIALAFEPDGIVQLYVARPTEAIAYRGSYSYDDGVLFLSFSDDDFHPDVSFALDTASDIVTMPFDVFTPDVPGPSTWRRAAASIENNLWMIFTAATVNEALPIPDAIARANAYAEALVGEPAYLSATLAQAGIPILLGTEPLADGVRLRYRLSDGRVQTVDVQLFGYDAGIDDTPLTASPLAGDPRVHLNPTSGLNGADDPPNKSAVLIAPFYTKRILSWNPFNPASAVEDERAVINLDSMEETLSQNGYAVTQLTDDAASVPALIRALRSSPGFILFSTHGSPDGQLLTGTYLGTTWSASGVYDRFEDEQQAIAAAGFGDLLSYRYDGQDPLNLVTIRNGMTREYESVFISLTPAFWHWLRAKGADFSHTLIYVSACSTAATVDLRDAVRARAFLGYDTTVTVGVSGAVANYLVASLARKTRSVEEIYYNIVRVARTRQMIYQEDALLDGNTVWGDGTTSLADHLQGFATLGPNSTSGPDGIVAYSEAGWLGAASEGRVAAGSVWWLLFGGRWSQNAETGANNLLGCWEDYWSEGQSPGLGNPGCENMQPGGPPSQDEVAYAIYLLTGQSPLEFSGISVPRWTLNDSTP